jgi:predicted RNA binding protein YcfA (HicA-like mRNA interferase family)
MPGVGLHEKRSLGKSSKFRILFHIIETYHFAAAVAGAAIFGSRLSRINGSHHIYVHPDVAELINLQNVNGQAKPYQVQQLLRLIERYNLQMEEEP